jgi:hypothetical protein
MFDKLTALFSRRSQYDPSTQKSIEDLHNQAAELGQLEELKSTPGWQVLEQKIRQELSTTILALIADAKDERGGRIAALMQVLKTVDTRPQAEQLEEIINKLI